MCHKSEILKVESLVTGYGENIILRNVSFTLQKGEVLMIIGQNGSGKSTLLKALYGLIPKNSGRIFFDNCELSVTTNKLSRLGISYFVQGGLIMPALTTEEHLQLASLTNSSHKEKKNFEEVFTYFSRLHDVKNKKAGNLSGGERQMLSFGILMMQGTKTWFLDEPTAGLAPSVVEFTTEFLQRKNKEEGITILIVEHNMDVAFQLASHIVIAKDGTVSRKYDKPEFSARLFLENTVYN